MKNVAEKRALTSLELCIVQANDLQERTRKLYLDCLERFISFAGTDPQGWRLDVTEAWLHELLKRLKPQTVRIFRKAIRAASAKYAKRHKQEDFAAQLDKIKALPSKQKVVLDADELRALLQTCAGGTLEDQRDLALIVVAARTGLRRGGLCALDWENVQPPKITTAQKGGGEITFDADPETFSVLDAWRGASGVTTGAVFRRLQHKRVGERMSSFQIWDVFRQRAKQAGVRHVHPHLVRHSTVTWLREAGVSTAEVSRLTGQTERTIADIYTHMRTQGPVSAALPPMAPKTKKEEP